MQMRFVIMLEYSFVVSFFFCLSFFIISLCASLLSNSETPLKNRQKHKIRRKGPVHINFRSVRRSFSHVLFNRFHRERNKTKKNCTEIPSIIETFFNPLKCVARNVSYFANFPISYQCILTQSVFFFVLSCVLHLTASYSCYQ